MSKILVMGGSYMQSGFIETAINKGLEVNVLDRDSNCLYAPDNRVNFFEIDISDATKVDAFLSVNLFDAYVAPVSEVGNITLSKLAKKYGFYYNSEETISLTTNKLALRNKLKRQSSNSHQFFTYNEVKDNPEMLPYPLIVKPAQSSASRGVSLVKSSNEFEPAIQYALNFCNKDELLIEKYAEGKQYSIETISYQGKHEIVAVVEENMSPAPYFIERSDIIDIEQQEGLKLLLSDYVIDLLNSLNIKVGPCHLEVKIDGNEIFLIEIASRSGLLRDRLIAAANIVDYNELIINAYLKNLNGVKIENNHNKQNALLNILIYEQDMEKYRLAKEQEKLVDEYFYKEKKLLNKEIKLTDAYGYFFVSSANRSDFKELTLV